VAGERPDTARRPYAHLGTEEIVQIVLHTVHQGPVVYCVFEGAANLANPVEAFRHEKMSEDASDTPLYFVFAHMDLGRDHPVLIRAIKTNLGDKNPAAVVLDTLNRSFVGSESSDVDMGTYIKAADSIREAFDCAVIVVHHPGLDETRPRGHSSLQGAVDAQLAVKRKDDMIEVQVELMKDGPQTGTLVSQLKPIEIGTDDDGDPVISLVIVPVDPEPESVPAIKERTLPHGASIALAALKEAIATTGVPAPVSDHIPADVRVTTIANWRIHAYARGISDSNEPRAKQIAFSRAHGRLVDDGLVGIWEEQVWIIRDKA
jgi:hypothetical protein